MRDDLPSVTAALVAFARGVASVSPMTDPPLNDVASGALLPRGVSWLIPHKHWLRGKQRALRVMTLGLVDQIALRTAAIDDALAGALESGTTQVVLLGAGLDARAYRIDALAATRVFEVDHPATQAFKRKKISASVPRAEPVIHVAVDFSKDRLGDALAAAGHDAARATCWIWEGVTMYLPRAATIATIQEITARCAPGSQLVMTYMQTRNGLLADLIRQIASASIAVVGEPLQGTFDPREVHDQLESHRLHVVSDENSVDWAPRFSGNASMPAAFRSERLVVATYGADARSIAPAP